MLVFLLLARESAEVKGDIRGREWTRIAIDRRMGGSVVLCVILSLPLVS